MNEALIIYGGGNRQQSVTQDLSTQSQTIAAQSRSVYLWKEAGI